MLLLLTSPLVSYNKLMKHLICTFVSKITDDEDEDEDDDDDDDDDYYYPDRPNCLYCPRVVFKYYHFIEDFSQSLRIDPSGSLLPRSSSKILPCASYFQLSSRCFIW